MLARSSRSPTEAPVAGKNYRDLVVWQKAMELSVEVYRATSSYPPEERYGLRSQMRSAAVSVPCNIAEGQGRRSVGAFRQHLSIAHGSIRELETQLLLSGMLGYLEPKIVEHLMSCSSEVGRLTTALSASLQE
jgi:four helix bundle protein